MAVLSVSKTLPRFGAISKRAAKLMRMFGVTSDRLLESATSSDCELVIKEGNIVYITGPSGSGKSVLLRELRRKIPAFESIDLDDVDLETDAALIDCVKADFAQAMRLLSIAGLNDVLCMLNRPRYLSEGQKYRFRLAMALAAGKRYIFADEFCSQLDRISASVISHNIRKFAKQRRATFILAGAHDDILADLQPDILVVKNLAANAQVIYKDIKQADE